jgi:aspartyl-tRNA(Asn)/glutamyl-tRNA(Gln) amidotransferase subunit A
VNDLCLLPATGLLRLYQQKEVSPIDTVDAVLSRIETCDPELNAFCLVDAKRARDEAKASATRWQRGEPIGLLDGVPVSIKDVLLTKGWPTLYGSRTVSRNQSWEVDAPAVARLREHGAILIGKTTTSEFHWKTVTDSPLTGITRNPWQPALTPGGSCGGAAVAVASGMGPLAIGTDGGGSIRVPCGFCGVFGLKPTFGRVPRYPPSAAGMLAHVGPITRSVGDAALLLTVVSQPDARDWYALPYDKHDHRSGLEAGVGGLRIAFSPDLGYARVDAEVSEVVARAALTLRELGAVVEEVSPGFSDPKRVFEAHWYPDIAEIVRKTPDDKKALMDPGLLDVADEGTRFTLQDYLGAVRERESLGTVMQSFHEQFDLLVTPTLPITAFEVGRDVPDPSTQKRWVDWAPFSYPFNLTRQPAATIPCGFTAAGLPVGLQVIGPLYREDLVLRACRAWESVNPIVLPQLPAKVPATK